jgi:hypothetical protein
MTQTGIPCRGMTDQQLTDTPIDVHAEAGAPRESEAVIREALGVIDEALAQMLQRELVSTGEVADLLLDVRTLLTASNAPRS